MITCRKMTAADVREAFEMLSAFLTEDEHYLASSAAYGDRGVRGVNDAFYLFLERPELGFVWMAYDEQGVAGICVVCYAISTSLGTVVAKLDDVSVQENRRGTGVGTAMIEQLKDELRGQSVMRIDVAVHVDNPQAKRFYEKLGFVPLNEERLACVI
jgi:GNAT superfamily N-acetyltransferase